VKNSRYDDPLLLPIDFVDHDIRQPGHHSFERVGIAANMANSGKRDQQFYAAEQLVHHRPRRCGAFLGNPGKDVFEIGNRLIVEDELHGVL
jgi:hypothetical protein